MEKKMENTRKGIALALLGIVASFMLFSFVSANDSGPEVFWACFADGETVDYCVAPDQVCGSSLGCKRCMSDYLTEEGCYIQGSWNKCNNLDNQECSNNFGTSDGNGTGGGTTVIDSTPPEMNLTSPVNEGVYTERRIDFILELSETSDVFYLDNINGRGRERRLCRDCDDYDRALSFRDGLNDLTFRVVDQAGLESFFDVTFIVDSRDPRISKTEPRRGFASGDFSVQITEDNPTELILYYGSEEDVREHSVDIVNECFESRGRMTCDIFVDVSDFDGEEIGYIFELTDVAGNSAESRLTVLDVDTTFPEIVDLSYEHDDRRHSRIDVMLEIDEDNFDEVMYLDNFDGDRARWKRLCSRLDSEGVCERTISLRGEGVHDIDIQVMDDAGNAVGSSFSVTI